MTDGGTEDMGDSQTVLVSDAPRRLFGNVLIDGADGQCIYIHAGIEERCPREAVAHTYIERGGESIRVEMCAEHAPEDVPEPPTTEQQELIPDGGSEEAGDSQMKEIEKLLEYAGRSVDGLTDEELLEAYREVEAKREQGDDDLGRWELMYLTRRINTLGEEVMSRGKSLDRSGGEIQYYEGDDGE